MEGGALVRGFLADVDAEVATIEERLVGGAVSDWTQYREAVARRQALLGARRLMTGRLSADQRRVLGVAM